MFSFFFHKQKRERLKMLTAMIHQRGGPGSAIVYDNTGLLTYWDFYAQPSRGITENGLRKKKHPWSCSCVYMWALLMLGGEWTDWLETSDGMSDNRWLQPWTPPTLKQCEQCIVANLLGVPYKVTSDSK